ncbi:hypothetical protein ACFFNY_25230 [Paenibacillus hodogayensis]|uniref:Uncharacterized protein n=1 Tax=Paenibacillus hodogayensis TaxID=279208 RepID=A0ABV5W2U1_9BACL
MGTGLTCLVTVTLASYVQTIPPLPPVTIPVNVNLLVNVPFPETAGTVTIDLFPLLGVVGTITVPCPSVTTQVVAITPILSANLIITVSEAP